jgi:biofilm PGA synthesis N-glycosyltransferase PgaC
MQIEFAITLVLITYAALILFVLFFVFWHRQNRCLPKRPVSILIPFRNEETKLKSLIESLEKLDLPKNSEILLINDNSTDNSLETLVNLTENITSPIKIIQSPFDGKKAAIEFGVANAVNDVIITSDADCVFHSGWACEYSQTQCENQLTVGLVWIKNDARILTNIQSLEQIAINAFSLFFSKISRPVYCSGANLAYDRETFTRLNPYADNKHIASGDDYFILKAFSDEKYPIKQLLTPKSFVYTYPVTTFKNLMHQKSRWVKKMILNSAPSDYIAIFFILFYIVLPVICLVFLLIGLISAKHFATIVIIKFGIDYLFLFLVALKFSQPFRIVHAVVVQVVYPIYVLGVVLMSIFGKINWKGRPV